MASRLRAALTARAHQVRTEDLAPLAPVVAPRPRWQSPWVVLATAAVVLLILGVVFQGLGPDPRSDRIAPRPDTPQPDAPRVTLPPDIGRAWTADDVVMGVRHRDKPVWGLQFHPESILTPLGPRLLRNFLELTA